jgi:hypothetical protein
VRDVRHAVGHARIEGEVSCKSLFYPLLVALGRHHHILVVFLRDNVQWLPNSRATSLFSESKSAWEKLTSTHCMARSQHVNSCEIDRSDLMVEKGFEYLQSCYSKANGYILVSRFPHLYIEDCSLDLLQYPLSKRSYQS